MRQVVLDTETTGLDPQLGHRIIEIAAVELRNRRLSAQPFHHYLNPEREIDFGAQRVHGISLDTLRDKPKFRDIVDDFIAYIHDAEVLIHNSAFDEAFLNAELTSLGRDVFQAYCRKITCTLRMAKDLHPGQRNGLDALCKRYMVDHSKRSLHGALLDAELLADVYLAMTRGQDTLNIDAHGDSEAHSIDIAAMCSEMVVVHASEAELTAHLSQLGLIRSQANGVCVWLDEPPRA